MQTARTLLTEDGATVAEVAGRSGYRSETAFSRAYKRVIGVPPSTTRVPGSVLRPVVGIRVSGYPPNWRTRANLTYPEEENVTHSRRSFLIGVPTSPR